MSSLEADCEAALDSFLSQRCWGAADEADELLYKIVQALRPSRQTAQQRQAVINRVANVLQGMPDFQRSHYRYGEAVGGSGSLVSLHMFGSFCSSLYHEESDLDLTITGQWRDRRGQLLDMATMSQRDQVDMLSRIRAALMNARVAAADPSNPPAVIAARVPLVVFTEAVSGVHVDISVANHHGAFKSRFLRELCGFDERLEELYRLVKLWAEVHGLNDPKSGTFNSWSIAQMVIFHLQKEGILPPLWQLFHNEPLAASRPLEAPPQQQQQQQQQQPFLSPQTPPPRSAGVRSSAPYEQLATCVRQRARLAPLYNGNSRRDIGSGGAEGVPGAGLLLLLAGFFVRFRELLTQWLEDGTNRHLKLSTWLGQWHEGVMWQHDYLVGIEDPFDSRDNTARTLGTQSHHNGGGCKLLDALDAAEEACLYADNDADLDGLLGTLFKLTLDDVADGTCDVLPASREQQQVQQAALLQQQRPPPPPPQRPQQQPFAGAAGLEQLLGTVRI